MSRLADYFAVVGYAHEHDRGGASVGKILQRFPEKDWENCPFTPGIELFCQPAGWILQPARQPPSFLIGVLTDVDADRHYCACLSFSEDVVTAAKAVDEDDELAPDTPVGHARLYAPKSLVLVSRLQCFDTFRNCLGLIYTVHMDNHQVELETLVGNLLGCVQIPPPGGPQVRFSLGAGDRQALQLPLSPTLPVTRSAVATLFQQLGLANALTIFCAALTDHKILFHSQSYTRLTEASHALTALMYPLKYSYVYIPLLPCGLLEVLSTPTPFIAGVHSSILPDVSELLDVIICDLDGGALLLPEQISVSRMPEPLHSQTLQDLYRIMYPELLAADLAFPPEPRRCSRPEMLDKEVRAVFLRFFAQLFFGYRSCLTIIRIHPEPFITFHKANFLGERNLVEDDFTNKVLSSMSFNAFVCERGPPFRVCDIFDEVFAVMPDVLQNEEETPERVLHNIRDLAAQLYSNEYPNVQPYQEKVARPAEGSHLRVHVPPFPTLDRRRVQEVLEEGLGKQHIRANCSDGDLLYEIVMDTTLRHVEGMSTLRPSQPRVVPAGPHIAHARDKGTIVATNFRRLEVMRACVNAIFENKISDARKVFSAVLRALKSRVARMALTEELGYHIDKNRALLEHQQFDLIVKLLNCALQNDSAMDENGVAAAILPLATTFCRKLCTGVIQFAYTCVQEHAVWANLQFWEAAFYQDVQLQIRQLYLPAYQGQGGLVQPRKLGLSPPDKARPLPGQELSALEIAAEQLREWPSLVDTKKNELIGNEESTVFSQAIHYGNRMVYMRVPLDSTRALMDPYYRGTGGESNSSNLTNSIAESDSVGAESGFEDQEVSEVGATVTKFVTRFIDKVCTDSNVTTEHIRQLHAMIPGVVHMHMETLDAVFRESKRLPPVQKPKILSPTLLPGEELVMKGLRVYLVPDGRDEGTGSTGGPALLPAEGAVFLTTYRIIFKGTPCDPLACEQTVCRSIPVSSVSKEKKLNALYLSHLDQWLQQGLQLRSYTFQLLRLAFDEEVSSEDMDALFKLVNKLRGPMSIMNTFAFTGYILTTPSRQDRAREKNASLKGFAKRTLMKTARKAGLKTKESIQHRSYILPTPPASRRTLPAQLKGGPGFNDDNLAVIDESEMAMAIQTDSKNLERLAERAYCRDYQRQGLGAPTGSHPRAPRGEPWRISMVNTGYSVTRSYPSVLVVPHVISDDSIRKLARTHRQYRFPVLTWRHPRTSAALLRAAGFHGKGVMGLLKAHHQHPQSAASTEHTSSSVEQEKYFTALVQATPTVCSYKEGLTLLDLERLSPIDTTRDPFLSNHRHSDSRPVRVSLTASADSLLSAGAPPSPTLQPTARPPPPPSRTPETARRFRARAGTNALSRVFSAGLRGAGARALSKSLGGLSYTSAARDAARRPRSTMGVPGHAVSARSAAQNGTIDVGELAEMSTHGLHRASLYILGEKTQVKGMKLDSFPRCDFIPIDYSEVRHVKSSFKKLLRACAPSGPPPPGGDPDKGFLHAVEESGWLPQIAALLQHAGAVVDLLDLHGASVMLCLEDGWDFTTQVVSLAQVLLDPYYRTVEGFCVLIDKEFLGFGHRFTHRSNQTQANLASGFAPIFLQFLDAVFQVHSQFPMSFEFNTYLLRFLAYHHVSNRFRTFMLDCEAERTEAGWLLEESQRHKQAFSASNGDLPSSSIHSHSSHGGAGSAPPSQSSAGISVWDYISIYCNRSPVFYNFLHEPQSTDPVLRPYSSPPHLKIWDYYLNEELSTGPSYDMELAEREEHRREEDALIDGPPSARRVVDGCYDSPDRALPDACTALLQELGRLEHDLGLEEHWQTHWDTLEVPAEWPHANSLTRYPSLHEQHVRAHGRSIHKRATLEVLVKGKLLGEAARMFSQPHRFDKFTYTTPVYCDYCSHVLWGLVKTGMRCGDCGYNCHEKCVTHVPKNCSRLRPLSEASNSAASLAKSSAHDTATADPDTLREGGGGGASAVHYSFAAPVTEHKTHEGFLFKRGHLLKGWKQRWFVLDSVKHQLRYYDAPDDANCKGFIDLKEVQSVCELRQPQGIPKRADESAVFEMKTQKRLYNFLAPEAKSAQKWINEIQNCIQ